MECHKELISNKEYHHIRRGPSLIYSFIGLIIQKIPISNAPISILHIEIKLAPYFIGSVHSVARSRRVAHSRLTSHSSEAPVCQRMIVKKHSMFELIVSEAQQLYSKPFINITLLIAMYRQHYYTF